MKIREAKLNHVETSVLPCLLEKTDKLAFWPRTQVGSMFEATIKGTKQQQVGRRRRVGTASTFTYVECRSFISVDRSARPMN